MKKVTLTDGRYVLKLMGEEKEREGKGREDEGRKEREWSAEKKEER